MENEKINNKQVENDEISLIDLFAVLFRYKWMIIITTFVAAVFILIYSVISLKLPPEKSYMPNRYTSEALMLINDSASQSAGLSKMLSSSGLGSMASLMGLSAGGGGPSYSNLALFIAGSNSFLDAVGERFNFKEKYKLEKQIKTNIRSIVLGSLKVEFSDKTGVFRIAYEDIDPEFAKEVVLFCVDFYENKFIELGLDKDKIEKKNLEEAIDRAMKEIKTLAKRIHTLDPSSGYSANTSVSDLVFQAEKLKMELDGQKRIYTELRAKYELLKIKMESNTPILQVLELPEVPERKSAPSRAKLCIIVTFAAFFMSIFFAFLLNAIKNIRNDEVSMAKLKGLDYEKK